MLKEKTNVKYNEIEQVTVKKNRHVVISACERNGEAAGYTIAQKVQAYDYEEGQLKSIYAKNAIQVENLERLKDLRDAITKVIELEEEYLQDAEDDGDWN